MSKKELVKTTKYLNDKNINRGSSGNLSYRIKNGFVITPSSIPNDKLDEKKCVQMNFDGTYLNHHHIHLLCDRMTCNKKLVSIFRHGINKDDIGPIAKASFEETSEMFLQAARHGELDNMKGVSANIMCGQEGFYGTSAFQIMVDLKAINEMKIEDTSEYIESNTDELIQKEFSLNEQFDNHCNLNDIYIHNDVTNIKKKNVGVADDEYDMGF